MDGGKAGTQEKMAASALRRKRNAAPPASATIARLQAENIPID